MDKKIIPSPRYIDGVIHLHSLLNNSFSQAVKIANSLLGIPLPSKESRMGFSIFVDFSEANSTDKIRGYFMSKNSILRFLPIEFDKALLFPLCDHSRGSQSNIGGISITNLDNLIKKKSRIRIRFIPINPIEGHVLFNIKVLSEIELPTLNDNLKLDDIGTPVYEFPDINQLSICDIPAELLTRSYTLVGKHYFAPFSKTSDINCVLFAQLDNIYDTNAIKVLRWLPAKKGVESRQLMGLVPDGGDVFFELGYVSRQENQILHTYMVSNDVRLLFGTIRDSAIHIDGGVKLFQTNEFKYPRCLYNIILK